MSPRFPGKSPSGEATYFDSDGHTPLKSGVSRVGCARKNYSLFLRGTTGRASIPPVLFGPFVGLSGRGDCIYPNRPAMSSRTSPRRGVDRRPADRKTVVLSREIVRARLDSAMVNVVYQNGITVVELESQYDSLDDESLGQLSQVLLEAVAEAQRPVLLLDFSKTRFIGSTFIGLMVRVWKRIRDRDGQMGLCCLAPFCRETLVIARLYDTLWTSYATREEALSTLSCR